MEAILTNEYFLLALTFGVFLRPRRFSGVWVGCCSTPF